MSFVLEHPEEAREFAIETLASGEHNRVTVIEAYPDWNCSRHIIGRPAADGSSLMATGEDRFGYPDFYGCKLEIPDDMPRAEVCQCLRMMLAAVEGPRGAQILELHDSSGPYTHAETLEDGSVRMLIFDDEHNELLARFRKTVESE